MGYTIFGILLILMKDINNECRVFHDNTLPINETKLKKNLVFIGVKPSQFRLTV